MALTFSSAATNSLNVTRYAAIEPTGSGGATWCAWLRRTGTTENYGRVFEKEYNNAGGPPFVSWGIEMVPGGTNVTVMAGQSGGLKQPSGSSLTIDTWTHVCGHYVRNSNLTLYVNGSSAATASTADQDIVYTTDSTGKVDIGGLTGGTSNRFVGDIAECAFWDVSLDAQEIGALADGFSPRLIRPTSLQLYVPLVRAVQEWRTAASITTNGSPGVANHPRIIYPRTRWARRFTTAAGGGATNLAWQLAGNRPALAGAGGLAG